MNFSIEQIRSELYREGGARAGAIWRAIMLARRDGEEAGAIAFEYAVESLKSHDSGMQTLNCARESRLFGVQLSGHSFEPCPWRLKEESGLFGVRLSGYFFEPCPWRLKEVKLRIREAGLSVIKADQEKILVRRNSNPPTEIIFEPTVVARIFKGKGEIFDIYPNTGEARFDKVLEGAFSAELEAVRAQSEQEARSEA